MSSPKVLVWRKKMHRSPLPFRAAGLFAEEFGHERLHIHTDCQGMPMFAVCGDDVVIFAQKRDGTNGNSFLTGIEMKKSPHLAEVVVFQGSLFKPTNAKHFAEQSHFLVIG